MDETDMAASCCENSTNAQDPWSISVKTVGGGINIDVNVNVDEAPSGERQFVVQVSPDDHLDSLYDQIEASTGLKASQQRLIYRGRLIGLKELSSNPKIKDIAGLSDGQTIHLVKRRETPETSTEDVSTAAAMSVASSDSSRSRVGGEGDVLSGSTGSRGLLAALLGLSSGLSEDAEETGATRRWGLGSSRPPRTSRRPHFRMTAEDRQVPDPGSLEPVRQGLLTLHTLLPHMQHTDSPIQSNREWYRGQWLDVLDTVNQWLEATVVEVVYPSEILPHALGSPSTCLRRRPPQLPCDPAVSASDLEGRRHLLLEPCDDENNQFDLGGDLAGFRPRPNNDGVQLLLIHYNGWPHRWDEWIRSDSERLRPFRTRTRHPNVSSTASPAPESVFHEAPRTNILPHGDDSDDRMALLPEVARAMAAANDILQQQITLVTESTTPRPDLPWATTNTSVIQDDADDLVQPTDGEETSNIIRPVEETEIEHAEIDNNEYDNVYDRFLDEVPDMRTTIQPTSGRTQYNQRELLNLATLFDRLGRTLTDAAPHIASLAASLPSEQPTPVEEEDLFDEAVEQALEEIAHSMPPDSNQNPTETSIGGLLSLWSRERRRRTQGLSNTTVAHQNNGSRSGGAIDPDHEDYISGLVNTTRGEVRSGPRSRVASDDVANLLGAYLAAATLGSGTSTGDGDGDEGGSTGANGAVGLGQLLRGGSLGGGGGGIDIHIHAVVTGPGMTPGGVGITTLGGGGALAAATGLGGTRNLFSSTQRRSTNTNSILRTSRPSSGSLLSSRRRIHLSDDEEDTGIFAELYSETPEPIDPNGSPMPGERLSPTQASSPNLGLGSRNDHPSDYITGLRTSYAGSSNFTRERETPADFLARVSNSSPMDHTNVGAASAAGRGVSSTRRRSPRQSFRRESADDASDTTTTRRGGWGRLFRRRSSRDDY